MGLILCYTPRLEHPARNPATCLDQGEPDTKPHPIRYFIRTAGAEDPGSTSER
jgi:hypothetical protein